MLQYVAVCCSVLHSYDSRLCASELQGVAGCCSVLQCVAACCSVLQCVHSCNSSLCVPLRYGYDFFSCIRAI